MAEQFGVVGRDDERRAIHDFAELARLLATGGEEVGGVRFHGCEREGAVIDFLVRRGTGDATILEAGEAPQVRAGQVGADVVEVEVEAHVAVEVAIARVAGIALVAAPDLACGFEVAGEGGDAIRREHGGEDAVARPRSGVQQPVRVHDEPADVRLLEHSFDALEVGAFRQPDAARVAAEAAPVVVARGEDLCADGGRVV